MALPDSFIEELTMKNNIEDVVSSYVNLRARGRTRVGLCPFHGEKTPSFTVYPENNSFYCFGCGVGGDVITFVKKIEHLDYMDAVRFLADRVGMQLPELHADDTASKMRRRVLEANREAARYFHECLYAPENRHALEYYRSRGYSERTIKRFGLGYAPDGAANLIRHLRSKGFRDEELLLAWLGRRSQKGFLYDSFRNRVIVPIIDVRGNVIAFGGRVLDDSKPKYLNTGDTPVFKKTNNLFALNIAKDSGRKLILCEGYMDVIALHQAGFSNAVAALGTSFTADHANLMARYADEAILIFDSDAAGQKGASRAMSLLRNTGLHVRVVRIPDGKDPDEFLRRHHPDDFKLLIDRSQNDVEYRLSTLKQGYLVETLDGKTSYSKEAIKLIATLQSPVERDVYASRLAQELSISKHSILQELEIAVKKKHQRQVKQQLSHEMKRLDSLTARVNPDALKHVRAAAAEEALLGFLLLHPDHINKVSQKLSVDDMITSFHRKLYSVIVKRNEQQLLVELSVLSASFSDDEMAQITYIYQAAQTRAEKETDADHYIDVIRHEKALSSMSSVTDMSDDDMRQMMDKIREMKQ